MEYRASLLASHGYAAMVLDYTDSSKVTTDTDMETFEVCVAILHFDMSRLCLSSFLQKLNRKGKPYGFLCSCIFVNFSRN